MKLFLKKILTSAVIATIATSPLTLNVFAENIHGDLNNDGSFDIADVVFMSSYLRGGFEVSNQSIMDFNDDYLIDAYDLVAMQRCLSGMPY